MTPQTLTAFLSAVPMPLLAISTEGRIVAANDVADGLFGPGLVDRLAVAALRSPVLQETAAAALTETRPQETDYLTIAGGRETMYRVRAVPISVQGLTGVLMSFEDITPIREAGQIRRDFVANVSHELRTPLTALIGFIETLRGAARDDPATRDRFLEIMEREASRMNRLVQDLLSLSRVEGEERMRPTAPVDPVDVVLGAVAPLRPMAEAAGVRVVVTAPPEGTISIRGDADQLQQVVANLVENAVKYGGQGGEVRLILSPVDVDPVLRGPAVRLEVEDDGEGIDPIHIPRLTERFYRVDGHRSRAAGGTGLGLAIVKHIVNRHRGRMRIDSEKGQGTRFTVLLPLA